MKTERVEKWLSLMANLAVLIGIVFLVLEVRQANHIAIAANEISVKGQFLQVTQLILANDGVAELLVKAKNADAEFSAVEYEKLYGYAYSVFYAWVGVETAYLKGMVTETTFNVILDDVREVLRYFPALRPFMRGTVNDFPSLAETQVVATIREVLAEYETP